MKSAYAALAALMLLFGCGPKPEDSAYGGPEPAKTVPSKTGAEPVAYRDAEGQLLCPVMNKVVGSEADAFAYQDYEGKRYYFCCAACPDAFRADPAKYAKR